MARETEELVAFIPTSVRLPADLRDTLTREATKNSRTLSHEIVKRLTDSIAPMRPGSPARAARDAVMHGVEERMPAGYGKPTTEHERVLLMLFAQMPPERQLALLTLLNGS